MAKITTGYNYKITRQMTQAAYMLTEGHSLRDIAITLFNCVTDDGHQAPDEAKIRKGLETLRRWQKSPNFHACYRDILLQEVLPTHGKAFRTIEKQLDDPNGWLANKAANDVLTRFGPAIMGEEDKQIVVQVQGMPEMGEPVDEE